MRRLIFVFTVSTRNGIMDNFLYSALVAHCVEGSRGAYRMVGHPSSVRRSSIRPSPVHTFDQLYLHSLQTDLNHFSSESEARSHQLSWSYVLLLKKPKYGFIISIICSVLIGSFWNLLIRWAWTKSWKNSIPCQIASFILELCPLDR